MTQTETEAVATPTRALSTTRVLAGVTAALVLVQGASAGTSLTGVTGALDVHRIGADVLSVLSIAIIVAAAFAARHLRWPLIASIVGFLAVGLQTGMGFERQLQIHLPLGLAIFGAYLTMALLIKTGKVEQ